jgi:hypothetical protein
MRTTKPTKQRHRAERSRLRVMILIGGAAGLSAIVVGMRRRSRRTAPTHPVSLSETEMRERLLKDLPVTERRLDLAGVSTSLLLGGEGPPLAFDTTLTDTVLVEQIDGIVPESLERALGDLLDVLAGRLSRITHCGPSWDRAPNPNLVAKPLGFGVPSAACRLASHRRACRVTQTSPRMFWVT